MRNFSSTAAIIVALESEPIQCLAETLKELETRDKVLLKKLRGFSKSKEEYFTTIRSSEDPYVPRLDFHLHGLNTILPSCLPNGEKMVNIMGCIELAPRMRDLTKFRIPSVAAEPETWAYLLKQLEGVEVSSATDDQILQRSRVVLATERDSVNSRRRALMATGFYG